MTSDRREAVIVEAVRTPVGKRNGSLADIHPADLSAHILTELVARTGIDPGDVEDVIWGCVGQIGDQSGNIGRYALLAAGWPETVPATTVNRACGSSQQALDFAAQAVLSGQYDMVVAGGVEVMSRVPLGAARAAGRRGRHASWSATTTSPSTRASRRRGSPASGASIGSSWTNTRPVPMSWQRRRRTRGPSMPSSPRIPPPRSRPTRGSAGARRPTHSPA